MLSLQLIFFLFFISFSHSAVPCGRCVGRGEVCFPTSGINCLDNLVCQRTEQNLSPLCLPAIEQGQPCTHIGVDTCEVDYSCNRTGSGNCDLSASEFRTRTLNDGCVDDRWCALGLSCRSGKCANDGACVPAGCPINRYCDILSGLCVDRPGEGGDCGGLSGIPCYPSMYCLGGKCKSYYSIAENEVCNSTQQCKPGLVCNCVNRPCTTRCVRPNYFLLSAAGGAVWGQECDPSGAAATGCVCNYATQVYMYLKETSVIYPDGCPVATKELLKCLSDKGCNQFSTFAKSCVRENCYAQYVNYENLCEREIDASLKPPRCSAQGLVALLSLLVIFLLF